MLDGFLDDGRDCEFSLGRHIWEEYVDDEGGGQTISIVVLACCKRLEYFAEKSILR